MKRIITLITIITGVLISTSCSKDSQSSEESENRNSETAKITITTKSEKSDEIITRFSNVLFYKKSDIEGKSHLWASTAGKMVYDYFILSIYFDYIDKINTGDIITPSQCWFSFALSSDMDASSYDYEGTITLVDKNDDQVVLYFDKVLFRCSFGDYLIDGHLTCPVLEH